MRELRGEMERLRVEREEWETEASREREKREAAEDEMAGMERREMENQREWERGREDLALERQRADNLQEVLSEFQAGESGRTCWTVAKNDVLKSSERGRVATSNARAGNAAQKCGNGIVRVQTTSCQCRNEIRRVGQRCVKISWPVKGDQGEEPDYRKTQT